MTIELTLGEEQLRLISAAADLLAACELGSESHGESGPAFLRRVAAAIQRMTQAPLTVAELRRKADAEEAAIAKARYPEEAGP